MNTFIAYFRVAALVVCALGFSFAAQAQTAALTYQGQLNDGAAVANGVFQMQFTLFDAAANGNQVGATITNQNVTVAKGIFTVQLDFSPATPFATGAPRFLQIAVKKSAETNYTPLDPRQQITSAPYAIRTLSAQTAQAADGLSANCVACVSNAQIAAVDGSKVTGGGAIANLNASNLTAGTVPLARLGTNTPTATTFLRGDNTFAPIPGGSGVTLQVSATNTAAQQLPIPSSSTPPANISFNNVITAPTAGTFNGTTFTATTAGLYLVTVSLGGDLTSVIPSIAVNGTTVAYSAFAATNNNIAGPGSTSNPYGRANISMILALNANDAVVIQARSGSTVYGAMISTDGTTRLAIAKLN